MDANALTVIIPTFNREKLISRALDSIWNQTQRPSQVIIVDDASTDGTLEVARDWSNSYPIDVVIEKRTSNSGPAAVRNIGIHLAVTPYIAFLDSDDEYLPHALETLIKPFQSFSGTVVSFADAACEQAGQYNSHAFLGARLDIGKEAERLSNPSFFRLINPKRTLLHASMIPMCSNCVSRDAAVAVGGFPETHRSGEDWLFWLRMSDQGAFIFQRDDLVIVHRHDENLTHADAAVFIAHQKLLGFIAIRDGTVGIRLDMPDQVRLEHLIEGQKAALRYHLSTLGIIEYLRQMQLLGATVGFSPTIELLKDLKGLVRSALFSLKLK
ncbi:glycosyltransferase family A protein [Chromatium okenii]|jgi:glycosyltransferase involved in cell wall biosynthesis|uniref:glycosyltransferase family 2 protein n=1 Tax=Chromatium okenii TaxID=61644 RepID=UPI0026EFC363|nr:glycosyltransferase family A protein [Chromatium okenii]MBV5310182.1 glycosyltransferase family 2 protein [Chromatium okenii]